LTAEQHIRTAYGANKTTTYANSERYYQEYMESKWPPAKEEDVIKNAIKLYNKRENKYNTKNVDIIPWTGQERMNETEYSAHEDVIYYTCDSYYREYQIKQKTSYITPFSTFTFKALNNIYKNDVIVIENGKYEYRVKDISSYMVDDTLFHLMNIHDPRETYQLDRTEFLQLLITNNVPYQNSL
jgi:hypothetical protein